MRGGERPAPPATRRLLSLAGGAIASLASRPRLALTLLLAAQWLLLLAFALTVRHNGWLYYQGGDQIWYATTAWELGHGDLPPTRIGYGWSLLLTPIMLVFGPGYVDAMPAVVALSALVLAPAALLAVYGIANRLAGRLFALWTGALWVAVPYLVIPLWRQDYHERFVEQFLPQALGLSALADYPSMVLLLCAAYFVVRALDEPGLTAPVLAGLLAGFALGTKPANALFLAGPALAFALARRLRPLLAFGASLVPALVALALWKQRGLGTLPLFAAEEVRVAAGATLAAVDVSRYLDLDWGHLRQNGNELREWFWSVRVLEWLPLAGALAVARRSLPVAGLLAAWLGAFVILKGTSTLATVESGSFFRYLMPAYPSFFLLAAAVPLLVPGVATRLARRWPPLEEPRLPRAAAAAAAVALGLVPIAVAGLARTTDRPDDVLLVNGILTPVDEGIELTIRADGEARDLIWTAAEDGVFYRVYRTAAGGQDVTCAESGGTPECALELLVLGTTREGRFRDGSPPPGSIYRVGKAANWRDDENQGDVFAISPPLRDPNP